jgi:hypothetical protein
MEMMGSETYPDFAATIERVAEHFAEGVDHHGAGIDPDAGGEFRRARCGITRVKLS